MKERLRVRYLIIATYVLAVLNFILDTFTPHGVGDWVLYIPIILTPVWYDNSRHVILASAAFSVLLVIGFFLSPLGIDYFWAVMNRVFVLTALWLTALAGTIIVNRSVQLREALFLMEREIIMRADIETELRNAQERLSLAMDGVGMGTWDANLRTGQELWSDTQFRLLGFEPTPSREASGRMWLRCVHPDDRKRAVEAKELARREHTLYHMEYRVCRPDNQKIAWIEGLGLFHYDENGEAIRYIGVCFDITRRKNVESEVLEITTKQQQEIGQELHDGVGQELTGLGLMAQTLAQGLADGDAEKRIAARLIDGLNQAHQKVRELARGLIPVHIDARGLAAALKDLAARTSEQSGISVTSDCPEWVEMPNHATATQMFRIAQEAVSNALRHGKPKQIRVTLLSQPSDLRLRIKDDGIGMQHPTENHNGLGLRIMKYRAGLIGGILHVGSSEASGTIVTLTLPWSKSNGEEEHGNGAAAHTNLDRR